MYAMLVVNEQKSTNWTPPLRGVGVEIAEAQPWESVFPVMSLYKCSESIDQLHHACNACCR